MQLTIGEIEEYIKALKKALPTTYKNIKVYVGDDDELNRIHCAWYISHYVEGRNDEEHFDDKYIIDMINDNGTNNEVKEKEIIILIS